MSIIVCDSGPIIHLYEAGILSLLKPVGEILMPQSVAIEILHITGIASDWPYWLQIVELDLSEQKEAEMWARVGSIHKEEAEAFVLARMKNAEWLLTDDLDARLFVSLMGLEVHGSLGVVLWNVAHENLSQTEAIKALNGFKQSSLWLSAKIFNEALKVVIEMTS